jgi:Flp pilus assembly protein TadD
MIQYQRAIAIKPDFASAHTSLGAALAGAGRLDEAILQYQKSLQIDPGIVTTHTDLGVALRKKGRIAEAIEQYQAALKIQPDNMYAMNNQAWLLATYPDASARNGARAVALAQKANALAQGKVPQILDTLAAAYAEVGRFPEAAATVQQAIQIAAEQKNISLAVMLQNQLPLLQNNQPLRYP